MPGLIFYLMIWQNVGVSYYGGSVYYANSWQNVGKFRGRVACESARKVLAKNLTSVCIDTGSP